MPHTRISTGLLDKETLGSVLEAVPMALFLVDRCLEIRWVNGKGESLLGFPKTSLIGQPIAQENTPWTWSSTSDLAGMLHATFRDGKPICGERFGFTTATDGKFVSDLIVNATPIAHSGGQMVLVAFEHVTPSPGSEERHGQAEHVSLTIQTAFTLTHELNQPLSVLVGNLDLLMSRPENHTPFEDRIDLILKSTERVVEIVRRLQAILRISKDHDRPEASQSTGAPTPPLT